MTYGEILSEIRAWLGKDILTNEEYFQLKKLFFAFANGFEGKWTMDIIELMQKAQHKLTKQAMDIDYSDLFTIMNVNVLRF